MSETIVACVQMHADRPLADNIAVAERLVAKAVARGAEVISLPERWNGTGSDDVMVAAAEALEGESARAMSAWARQHGVWLHGGSIGEDTEPGVRASNTTLVFDPQGNRVSTYRKIHMFDIDVEGAEARESAANKPGDQLVLSEIAGWPVGLTICYDLRFPEQYRELALAGAEAFMVPAGFTMATGRDHWEILLRARAIENAAYVIAANQHGFWAGDLVRPVDVHGDFIPATSITDPALCLQWQGWLKGALEATSEQAARTRAALDRQRQPELADTEELKLEPVPQLVVAIATGAQRIGANTSGLAAHLANEGVLPMYGLPTRVRDLVVGQDSAKRETISLDRDLEVAIYEFAPGNVLVHDKREHRCIGLTPRIGRVGTQLKTLQEYPWDLRLELGCCPICGAWQDVASERDAAELNCPSCQTTSAVGDWEIRSCLEPAAFRTDFTASRDLDGLSGSQSHALSADAAPPQAQDWRVWPKSSAFGALEIQLLCNSGCTVYRLNRGPDANGFQLTWREGVLRRMNANNVLRASDDPALKAQAIDSRLLSGAKIRSILAKPLDEPADDAVLGVV